MWRQHYDGMWDNNEVDQLYKRKVSVAPLATMQHMLTTIIRDHRGLLPEDFTPPTTSEECFLQIMGENCDEHDNRVWSFLDMVREPVRAEPWRKNIQRRYFDMIVSGEKTVEGRLYKGDWEKMLVGDTIIFTADGLSITTKVIDITVLCSDFGDLYDIFGGSLMPCMTRDETVEVYRDIYGDYEDENGCTVAGFSLQVID